MKTDEQIEIDKRDSLIYIARSIKAYTRAETFAVRDVNTFPYCIADGKEKEVRERYNKSNKDNSTIPKHPPVVIGIPSEGAVERRNERVKKAKEELKKITDEKEISIFKNTVLANAAKLSVHISPTKMRVIGKEVLKTEAGECSSFASHAFNTLIDYLPEGTPFHVVAHDDGYGGTHNYALLNFKGRNVTFEEIERQKNNIIIVDAWALALGYNKTNGIFTLDNYPFIPMMKNLRILYQGTCTGDELQSSLTQVTEKIIEIDDELIKAFNALADAHHGAMIFEAKLLEKNDMINKLRDNLLEKYDLLIELNKKSTLTDEEILEQKRARDYIEQNKPTLEQYENIKDAFQKVLLRSESTIREWEDAIFGQPEELHNFRKAQSTLESLLEDLNQENRENTNLGL